jgi:hypothetical protein
MKIVKEPCESIQKVPTGYFGGHFSKEPTTYLLGNNWVNCFRAHKELTMDPLGKFPLAPSDMMDCPQLTWPEAPIQSLGPLHVHFEGDQAPSEDVYPNNLPGGDSGNWPFVVAPCPVVPVAPDALYFRDGELVCILGQLVWFETDGGHMIIQDAQDSHGPRDPESVRQAIVDLRDEVGSAHWTLFGMQNVMDDHQVEQNQDQALMREMSVQLHSLEMCFESFILDKWAPFQSTILQALTSVAFAWQAGL